jgi:hypothetical protein
MDITGGVNIRAAWYDRNPVSNGKDFFATNITAHSFTQRMIYTCPADKKAWVNILTGSLYQVVAPGTPNRAQIKFVFNTGEADEYDIATDSFFVTQEPFHAKISLNPGMILNPGETISYWTENVCGGAGNSNMSATISVTEFDA